MNLRRALPDPAERWMQGMFFLSGVAALAYQVCWQRILFFSLGTDIESITMIVATFMLGLGLGALGGGWMADRRPHSIIPLFACAELGIGAFGILSPYLITGVAELLIQSSRAFTAAATFVLLLFPTCLMGATLPMLIAHFVRTRKSVGISTGQLYFVNTLGAAVGCVGVGFFAFNVLTIKEVIALAAAINALVAVNTFLRFRTSTHSTAPES